MEDPSVSPTDLQLTTPYGPTSQSSPYLNMNDYLYDPFSNPTSQPYLAPTLPYPRWATGVGSELYNEFGYKRSLNKPIPKPKAPPAEHFNPNDPFWQTDIGRWFLSVLAGMVDNWNNPDWWAQHTGWSYENRYTDLQNLIRQMTNMFVGTDSQGNPIHAIPPNVQDISDTRWRKILASQRNVQDISDTRW